MKNLLQVEQVEQLENGNFRIAYFYENDGKDECTYINVSYDDLAEFYYDNGYDLNVIEGFDPFSKYGYTQRAETVHFSDFVHENDLRELAKDYLTENL